MSVELKLLVWSTALALIQMVIAVFAAIAACLRQSSAAGALRAHRAAPHRRIAWPCRLAQISANHRKPANPSAAREHYLHRQANSGPIRGE